MRLDMSVAFLLSNFPADSALCTVSVKFLITSSMLICSSGLAGFSFVFWGSISWWCSTLLGMDFEISGGGGGGTLIPRRRRRRKDTYK